MKKVITFCAAALLWAALFAPSYAEAPRTMIARDANGNTLVLRDTDCKNPDVLRHIPPQYHPYFAAGVATIKGEAIAVCWTFIKSAAAVVIVTEGGRSAPVPASDFTNGGDV